MVSLAGLRGRPVVVNFWASWCIPCRDEFPMFRDKLAEYGAAGGGLAVVGVLYKDEADLATSFVSTFGATWPTVVDPDGAIADAYRVVAPPQSFFIDKDGVIRSVQIGEMTGDVFDTLYAKIKP
jgi:cytochrome c biogenesis protein CcmG/thiol:disulfide interchange protein DsbE